MTRVLVTGGAGFTDLQVAEEFLKVGHIVAIIEITVGLGMRS